MDPTFNICSYNIISTYCLPLSYNVKSNAHPLLLGPTLIHSSKTLLLLFITKCYVTTETRACQFKRAFGTDGVKKMFEAIGTCFNNADHLLCWIHVKDNISQKLESECIETPNEYMCEIFGKTLGTTKVKRLLDVTSEDHFELEWKILEVIWKDRGSKGALFLSYRNFNKKYYEEIYDS